MWVDNIKGWTRLSFDNKHQLRTGLNGEEWWLKRPFKMVHPSNHIGQRLDIDDEDNNVPIRLILLT